MKLFLSAIALSTLFLAPEVKAHRVGYQHHHYGTKYSRCYKKVYRETHVRGTWDSPGHVKIYRKKKEVPCVGHRHIHIRKHKHHNRFRVFIDL